MERAEWLKTMRARAEALYDRLAPSYWVTFGLYANETHLRFIARFLDRLAAHSTILDAACGAGRYDRMLLQAGHSVLGIDQSGRMLARAREVYPEERFPALRYARMGLQEISFEAAFDGVICIDALEHVCPEDWPDILARFQRALAPGGVLYVTVELAEWDEVDRANQRARALGLPVVPGEVVDEIDSTCAQIEAPDARTIPGLQADGVVYHYYPPPGQVHVWLDRTGLALEEEGTGDGYAHLLARKVR